MMEFSKADQVDQLKSLLGPGLPIASAPKDTAVLIFGFCFEVAHFNSKLGRWALVRDHAELLAPPTRWWPLPEIPAG